MKDEPKFVEAEQDDADFELTQLEFDATQRTLTLDEQELLNKLRRERKEINKDVIDRISPPQPETGNTVVSGDDSP